MIPKKLRLSLLALGLITTSLCLIPLNASAHQSEAQLDKAYDDGYEDGYEDCMKDHPCSPFLRSLIRSGFYAGADVGFDSYGINRTINVGSDLKHRINPNGWMGAMFAGYAYYFMLYHFYLAGEIFLGTSGANTTTQLNSSTAETNIGTSYGFVVKPGYKLPSGPLVYLNLGYNQTQIKTNERTLSPVSNNDFNKWAHGFQYGLGAETPIYKNLNLRLEYNRIDYGSFTNPTTRTYSQPADNRGTLGLVFRF